MNCRNALSRIVLGIVGIGLVGMAASPRDATAEKPDWLTDAEKRIEACRQGDFEVTVLDAEGRPVVGAKVAAEQVRHDFLFGCNIFQWGRISDPELQEAYLRRFTDLLNYATAPFYWPSYESEQGKPNHDYTERLARWCKEHGVAVKGHPLAWNFADPRWLPDDPQEIYRLQIDRITDCVSRFRGLIDRWDVVNEATHFDREQFARRAPKMTRMWSEVGQVEFARRCFMAARSANPEAVLLINDYRTDPAYAEFIEKLVDDQGKRLYDVIGIQSHMHSGVWPNEQIRTVCERFARFGVPLHFTEMTIVSGAPGWERPRPWPTTPEGEERQAREVTRFYTMLFAEPAVEAITWWDFSDYHAWQGAPAGLVREDMSPKPAYEALLRLVKGEWWSRGEYQSDENGKIRGRVFYGEHRFTVELADGRRTEVVLHVAKGAPNVFQIRLAPQ
ncbi:MAG: endo-1,4-beta-xylanase [Thermogutta sp.]